MSLDGSQCVAVDNFERSMAELFSAAHILPCPLQTEDSSGMRDNEGGTKRLRSRIEYR
jgi:hypothetical protein